MDFYFRTKIILYMRYIYRSLAGSEAEQGQKGCDPVELCNPPEFFRNPPELQARFVND